MKWGTTYTKWVLEKSHAHYNDRLRWTNTKNGFEDKALPSGEWFQVSGASVCVRGKQRVQLKERTGRDVSALQCFSVMGPKWASQHAFLL